MFPYVRESSDPRDEYLAWLKERLMRFDTTKHINLALSGVWTDKDWLADTLRNSGGAIAIRLDEKSEYGLEPLKAAITQTFGIDGSHEVILTTGASGGIARVYQSLLVDRPKAQIAVETPTYGPLVEIPRRLGAQILPFDRYDAVNDLDRVLTTETQAVVLSNPSNPTSHFLTPQDQLAILDVVERRAPHALLILDHTFAGLLDPKELVLRSHPRAICISSLSKCFGAKLNLLRIGWVSLDPMTFPDLIGDAVLFENSGCKVSEILGLLAFAEIGEFKRVAKKTLRNNFNVVNKWLERVQQRGLLERTPFHGGSVLWARLPKLTDSSTFVDELFSRDGLLVAPGCYFEGSPSNGIRIGVGGDSTALEKGLEKLEAAL